MFIENLLLYVLSFVLIWIGAGFIVSSASRFSQKLKLSPFAFSFVFLGLLTSTPEFSVGLQAVASHDAQIFVGNLLGGILVLFLIVIPLLAIFGNGIYLKNELEGKTLIATLLVILAPSVFILDKKMTSLEGVVLVILYIVLLFLIEKRNGIFDRTNNQLFNIKAYSYKDMFLILIGIGILFTASNVVVDKTLYFSDIFNISAFYISLIVVSIGTNIPELSLAIRSAISGKKDVAMGDYLGSAAVNTFLFGVLTLLNGGEVVLVSNFMVTFIFISAALIIFYILSTTKNYISRANGFVLLGIYCLFVVLELI